jgi:hypothetical protein
MMISKTSAILILAVTAMASATAAEGAGTVGYVKNRHSGKCLTVHGASKANNASVDQYKCVGAANQRWTFEWAGGMTYALRNVHSGKCLTVHGASEAKGARLDQYTCVSAFNQSFVVDIASEANTQLKPRHARGKCLDVQGGSKANNASVIQWSCNGRPNQRWSVPGS